MFSKMIYSLALLSFVGFLAVPALVDAAALGEACGQSSSPAGAGCVGTGVTCDYDGTTWKCVNVKTQKYGLGSTFTGLGVGQSDDLKGTIADIINIVLGFLGIVAVILILAGGFKWMTAGGNEDSVGEAKKMIYGGIIGLVVIFAAWAIASFVIAGLQGATAA